VKTSLRFAVFLALVFLALHLPLLPVSLEDLDSINFALGLRHFDVAQHQPHPPGYPVFIALARLARWLVPDEARALALVSVVSGAFAVLALWVLVVDRWANPVGKSHAKSERQRRHAVLSVLLASTAPLFWVTAARPLSDMAGLAAALGVQALLLTARAPWALTVGALLAGVATGIRSQVLWLTLPVLAAVVWTRPREARRRAAVAAVAAFGVGALLWAVPLVVLSGGPSSYLRALATQGSEDFAGVAMLATRPSPRLMAAALYATLIAPWGWWFVGATVLVAALIGAWRLGRGNRSALAWLVVLFGPYAAFHLVFQETATTRYALPLVVPMAILALHGLTGLTRGVDPGVAIVLIALCLWNGMSALVSYSAAPAPAFRVLDDMAATARAGDVAPVLAMHRRQELDMRRPIVWNGQRVPAFTAHLPSPAKHEWLELVKYWNEGGRAPVWFLADPPRSDLHLIDLRAQRLQRQYRWGFDATALLGGIRPNVMDWYEIRPPDWYLGEGWALTPETAGVANEEGRGPGRAPIAGWVRRRAGPVTLMIGGRNLATDGAQVPVNVAIDGRQVASWTVAPGFFLEFQTLDTGVLTEGGGDYAALTVSAGAAGVPAAASSPPGAPRTPAGPTVAVAIEQFDAQPVHETVFGFGEGWQELEYNPATGRLWRWTSERAVIRLVTPPRPLVLRLAGEFETKARTAHVTIKAGDRLVAERDVPRSFSVEISIPREVVSASGETRLSIETDQWYVPAETNWRPTADRRHLGLRLFQCDVRPAS